MQNETMTTASFPKIFHGADYYPEQWSEDVWDDDVRLMQEANVTIATLPVFGWVNLQPDEDTFTFDWLDCVIDKLTTGGIWLCLATATGSVPAWADQKYPDILRVESNGHKRRHGERHTFCPNSPNFRRLAVGLARQLSQRYGSRDNLAVWHIGNEYSNTCYCDNCAKAFRTWLLQRYQTLDEVNVRWYTLFWGHRFTDWSQVEPPYANGERSIQPLLLDYDRFQSDSLLECYKLERDVLRANSPNVPITTNLMGSCKPTDYHKWAKEMDLISWDSYPTRGAAPSEIAFQHSLMRGVKEGDPWILMEQTPSQQNWQAYNALKRPGVMRLWSFQAMAHGADAVMYFQWRRSRGCCEKFHGAVVEHAGRTDVRVFQEVKSLGKELENLGALTIGARNHSQAALLFDWETWWALDYSAGPSVDLKYLQQAQEYYGALHRSGIVADIVSPDADLSGYKVVLAPALYMVKPGVDLRLKEYVASGGTFVTTYFSGIVDETDQVFPGGYPGPLRELLGIWVEETDVLSPSEQNSVLFSETGSLQPGVKTPCGLLCDRIRTEYGAETLATYVSDFYAGEPAITVNRFGKGSAYYLGTKLSGDGLGETLNQICELAGVTKLVKGEQPITLELTSRVTRDGTTLTFAMNHSPSPVSYQLTTENAFVDLLTGTHMKGPTELPGYGVAIFAPLIGS